MIRQLAKWIFRISVGLFLALCFSLLFPSVRHAVWTTLFLADFVAGENPSLFKRLTDSPTAVRDTLSLASGLQVPFDLYRTPSEDRSPAIIFTHGFAHEGYRDPRIQAQSRRLARAGFAVMAPDLQQMKHYQLGFEDADALTGCLAYLRQHPQIDSTRIGVIAPSFGAGPVLIAISRPQVCDQVQFGLIFGGYFDLKRTLTYTLTGAYDAEGQTGLIDPSKNRHNRWKFLHGNAHLLPPSSSREQFLLFVEAKRKDPGLDIHPALPNLDPAERRTLTFMDNENPALFDSLFATIPGEFHAWIDTLSLHHYAPDITAPLLIVHSRGDNKVHFSESLTLARSLPNAHPPLIVGLFSHVDLKLEWSSFGVLWNEVLPGLKKLWSLAHQLLGYRD
jgi:dienelactone hydrolase